MKTGGQWLAPLLAAGLVVTVPTSARAQENAPSPAPEHLVLVGVTEIGSRSEAWLVNVRTGGKVTLRPGESAFGFRLEGVGPEQATLTRGKERFVLRVGERELPVQLVAGSRSEVRTPPEAPVVTVREAPSTPPVIEQHLVTEVVVPDAAADARANRRRDDSARETVPQYPPFGLFDWSYPNALSYYYPNLTPTPYATLPGYAEWGYPTYPPPYYTGGAAPFLGPTWGNPRFPTDFPRTPYRRWNPQSFRRQPGDYWSGMRTLNPQTERRRLRQGTWLETPTLPYWPRPYQFSPYVR